MNETLDRIKANIERQLRGPAFSNFLKRFDINPKRYWLLIELFRKLSERGEMQGELGRQTHALRVSTAWFFLISAVAALAALGIQPRPWAFAALLMGGTAFILLSVLMSEAASSLVNPEEALSLSHQPINGATYTAAKLSHLFNIVFYTVMGGNLIPALAMPLLKASRWFYPPLYLAAALTMGFLIALLVCSIYGLVMRFVPARRMKSASQFVQAIPIAIYSILQFSPRGTTRRAFETIREFVAPLQVVPSWILGLIGIGAIGVVTITGLRSLSADYLIRASAFVHGQSTATTRVGPSFFGEIVRLFFGGQIGRAGFDYTKRMLLRDWQFRRRLMGFVPTMLGLLVGIFASGWKSPFDSGFSATHFVPQVLGFVTYSICMILPFGNDYKGVWIFQMVADRAYRRFARGVHASLWLTLIAAPYVVLFPLLIWRWGIGAATAFLLYGVASSSVYLAFGLRSIEGIPFGKQSTPGRDTGGQGGARIFGFLFAAALAAFLEYLVFRSGLAVILATFVFGAAAYLLTRWSLSAFETAIRHHVSTTSRTSTMIYTEV